jgi:hypothetical protein
MPADFNEEIVCSYFELQGYFVRMNVPYRPPGSRNDASDIDIVAVHPVTGDCVACEVKGWHTERLTMSYWKDWPLLNFTCEPANEAVRALIGDRPFRHLLVIPPIGLRQRNEVLAYAAERDVEMIEWPQLIETMLCLIDPRKSARNQTDHVLRVLIAHGFIQVPAAPADADPVGEVPA